MTTMTAISVTSSYSFDTFGRGVIPANALFEDALMPLASELSKLPEAELAVSLLEF
jgi:hypothetical protein